MTVEKLNPRTLATPEGFAHVGIGTGSRVVFLAGQVSQNVEGEIVGTGDLAAQTEQALINVAAGLEAAGATLDDIAKITLYVVDWDESKMEQLMGGVGTATARLGAAPVVPTTLVPVPRLFEPGYLIEIDVTAVLD
jgi:enamine deaminase RidA (YjgF/YER057c/UK114 family)